MTNTTSADFKCLQWNARGFTKAKLEEFRHFLSLVKKNWRGGAGDVTKKSYYEFTANRQFHDENARQTKQKKMKMIN
jgi:hypothetical protein